MKWVLPILAALALSQENRVAVRPAETAVPETQTAPADQHPAEYRIPTFYVSAYVTNPQVVSVSLISGFTMQGTSDHAKGVFFELEPGLGGGKVAVGHGVVGAHGMHWNWKGALLRSWGDPWGVQANETFVGAEGALGDFGLSFRLGAYGDVSGGPDNWLLSAGIGFFFN